MLGVSLVVTSSHLNHSTGEPKQNLFRLHQCPRICPKWVFHTARFLLRLLLFLAHKKKKLQGKPNLAHLSGCELWSRCRRVQTQTQLGSSSEDLLGLCDWSSLSLLNLSQSPSVQLAKTAGFLKRSLGRKRHKMEEMKRLPIWSEKWLDYFVTYWLYSIYNSFSWNSA